jgi:hypothetical protein
MIRINSKIEFVKQHINEKFDQLAILDIDMEKSSKSTRGTFVIVQCSCSEIFSKSLTDMIYHKKNNYPNRCNLCFRKTKNKDGELLQWNWFNTTLQNAKSRNLEISIDILYCEELWKKQNEKCALSGIVLTIPKRTYFIKENGKKSINYSGNASLDRIDSNKGYIKGNVQWIHKRINTMKMNMTDKELIDWCKLISNYRL